MFEKTLSIGEMTVYDFLGFLLCVDYIDRVTIFNIGNKFSK